MQTENIRDILKDCCNGILSPDLAMQKIQKSLIPQIEELYNTSCPPEDISEEVSTYNEAIHECVNIINTL